MYENQNLPSIAAVAAAVTALENVSTVTILSEDFILPVLAALAAMAGRSRRREAEVRMAAHAFGLESQPHSHDAVLARLAADGCIANAVRLNDGGLIVVVTAAGFDRLRGSAFEYVLRATAR